MEVVYVPEILFDPRTLGGWEAAPPGCPAVLKVDLGGGAAELRCEEDDDHDIHSVTLKWST